MKATTRKLNQGLYLLAFLLSAAMLLPVSGCSQMSAAPQKKSKFVHTVFFWMKKDLSNRERKSFEKGLASLKKVPTVKNVTIGTPANTQRDVVDNSYDYFFQIVFDDKNAHDFYQVHEIHQAFINESSGLWIKVQVYDAITQ